jgi:hypothetical protein
MMQDTVQMCKNMEKIITHYSSKIVGLYYKAFEFGLLLFFQDFEVCH